MLVVPADLRELLEPSGVRFQNFVTALVVKEALSCGLNLIDIDGDYRINHRDGGCDIFVSKGQHKITGALIPDKPSIWSIKAGENGIKPAQLADELTDKAHPRLCQHLKEGHVYFWCALAPAGQNERVAMREKGDTVATKLGVDPQLIRFVWSDHLCGALNRYLNLIAAHLPALHSKIGPMMTLDQWKEESPDRKGLKVPYVNVPGSKELEARIKGHLLEITGDAVFHLAGLSGIGKTRTTIETCLANVELADTLYISEFSQIQSELWRRLKEPDTHLRLIIDEVPLDQVTRLQNRFDDCGDRVRIVSIGPAPRGQSRRQRDPMLQQLEPPDETTGVLPIVESAAPELTVEVRKSIAHFSGHDLRLALLLVEATRKNGEFSTAPLRDYEDVWKRIMFLFRSEINDPHRFRQLYELLTLSIDIGHAGGHRTELQLLASLFNTNEADLDGAIRDAGECGLGDRLQNFFEAKPAALAVWLFQERLWPMLSPRLDEFVAAKPSSRLLRRFLERCQETSSPFREDMESRMGVFFLRFLGDPELKILIGREASRIFQAWAEFDPGRGLAWLERAVISAADDDLRQFTGDADGSGGWSGRRQIVWLCEHLACFSEYFGVCEHILFRLSQVETEIRIGNNSTNTWRKMFLPLLANTEVPFPRRLQLLNKRLLAATSETIELVLSAYYGSIERFVSRAVPPSIVGGRIVPDQWEPKTVHELERCRLDAAKAVLSAIPNLANNVGARAARSVVEQTAKFLAYGIVDELRDAIAAHLDDESLKRQLSSKLDDWLSWQERKDTGESRPEWIENVRRWREEMSPITLAERIKDFTARDYWSVYRVARSRISEGEPADAYAELAKEALQQPAIVEEMAVWLKSPEAVSAANLLFQLGFNDTESKALPTVLKWLEEASGTALVANYLKGVRHRSAELPEVAVKSIDDLAIDRPTDAVHITLLADASDRGLRRLMAALPRLEGDQRGVLRQLSFDPWKEIFGTSEKNSLLQQFCAWAKTGDPNAVRIAMDIFTMWRYKAASSIPADLIPVIIQLAKLAATAGIDVDDHNWKEVMEALADLAPQQTAELLAEEITDVESNRFQRGWYAQEVFRAIAKKHPETAMQAIGKWILDKRRSIVFRLFEFRGLFDAIGLQTVMPWVEKHGNAAAIAIARHLSGPRVENGVPIIPELADWLLPKYEHVPEVFREFAMGRHSGQVRSGRARDRETELETLLAHFEGIPKDWVKNWIEYERASHRSEVEWDDRDEEERSRV